MVVVPADVPFNVYVFDVVSTSRDDVPYAKSLCLRADEDGQDKLRIPITTFTARLDNNAFTLCARHPQTRNIRTYVIEQTGEDMQVASFPIGAYGDDHGSQSKSQNKNHKWELGF
ncbi:hypothetical protein BCR44DRAFT_1423589, partial [Catenaria anguillulae PL171]